MLAAHPGLRRVTNGNVFVEGADQAVRSSRHGRNLVVQVGLGEGQESTLAVIRREDIGRPNSTDS